MRQTQLGQQLRVAFEEIRISLQVFADTRVVESILLDPTRLTRHCFAPVNRVKSIEPVKTVVAGPVSHRCSSEPVPLTIAVPPGKSTLTSPSSSPRRLPAATAAQAP